MVEKFPFFFNLNSGHVQLLNDGRVQPKTCFHTVGESSAGSGQLVGCSNGGGY